MSQGCNPQAGHVTPRASGGSAQPETSQLVTPHSKTCVAYQGALSDIAVVSKLPAGAALRYVNDIGQVAEQVCCFRIERRVSLPLLL